MQKKTPVLVFGFVAFAAAFLLALWNPLQVLDWKISDLFFRSRTVSKDITLVVIDEKSLDPQYGIGRFKDWPRSYYAKLLQILQKHKPATVAFDLDFREQSQGMSALRLQQMLREHERLQASGGGLKWYEAMKNFESGKTGESGESTPALHHPDDVEFQQAIDASGFPVTLSSTFLFDEGVEEDAENIPEGAHVVNPIFGGPNVHIGFRKIFADRDGVVRRFNLAANGQDFFAAAIFKAAGKTLSADISDENVQRIRYRARTASHRTISFVDVFSGNYDPEDFEGKIVIVGATASILQDTHPTPTSRDPMAGPEILANITAQFLEGETMNEQGLLSLAMVLAVLCFGGAFLFLSAPLRTMMIVFGVVFIGYPLAAFALYQTGAAFSVVYPEIAWTAAAILCLWRRNQTEFREKRVIQKAFAHYVSPVVVKELARHPELLKLGGTRKQVSVMFSDIVGFTSLAEKLTPEDMVALLNDYLTTMTEIVYEYHGTLDKYQGDAIMAVFGAPLHDEHHAVNACHTALGMRRALAGLHEKWNALPSFPQKEKLLALDFRVGIATGPAVVGNVGSEKRFDYTAIGDIVNLGSRLESVNRKYGTHVIVDKNTFVTVTENHNPFVFRKLDMIRVKGRETATEIFEVVALAEHVTTEQKAMLDDFENGRIQYSERNFIDAKQYFESCITRFPEDGPSQIYRNRCNFYLRKPPGREWDAVVGLEEK